jgi:hypothetical protein
VATLPGCYSSFVPLVKGNTTFGLFSDSADHIPVIETTKSKHDCKFPVNIVTLPIELGDELRTDSAGIVE